LGLSTAEEIKQSILEAVNHFRNGEEKRFSEISPLNETLGFLNHHALLRSGSIVRDMNKFKSMCDDDNDRSGLH